MALVVDTAVEGEIRGQTVRGVRLLERAGVFRDVAT